MEPIRTKWHHRPDPSTDVKAESVIASHFHRDLQMHGKRVLTDFGLARYNNLNRKGGGEQRERQQAAKRGGGQTPLSLQAEDPETGLTLDPPSQSPGPDFVLANAEQGMLVRKALDQLDQSCREIIELRYFADLSYDEISRSLELNPKTVSSRLSKCLDHLESIARKVFYEGKSAVFPSNS